MDALNEKCGKVARFYDYIIAACLLTLGLLYSILVLTKGGKPTSDYILVIYYFFFGVFMIGVGLRYEKIIVNFGFLESIILKSVFYIL